MTDMVLERGALTDGAPTAKTRAREGRDGLKLGLGRPGVVAAVDLGASKVACFIMKPEGVRRSDRTLTTAGVGHVQSSGVRGGAIVDMDEAAHAIGRAVERAEAMAGVDVQGVTVTTTCGQLASHRVSAKVALGGRPISEADQARCVAQAMNGLKLARRQAIHLQPIGWIVDGQRHVQDPKAMFGRTLGLEMLVVSMNDGVFQTLAPLRRAPRTSSSKARWLLPSPRRSRRSSRTRWNWARSASTWAAASTSVAVYSRRGVGPYRQPQCRRRPTSPRTSHADCRPR